MAKPMILLLLRTPNYCAKILCPINGTLGSGADFRYPYSRVPAHPLRVFGACALGNKRDEFGI